MRLRVTATLALLLFVCLPVFAQQTTGTIVGAVTDTSGAVVRKATVTVTNLDTNAVVRTVTTNDAGEYAAPLLPVGHYSVQVASGGFKTSTKTGVELNVNDRLSVNIALSPGNAQETINVEANANQVETQSATSQGLITGTQVRELALSARNYEELVAPDLTRVPVPTLLIHGEDDVIIPPQIAEAVAGAIPQAELVVLEGAGHVPTLTQPERVVDTIARWAAALPPRPRSAAER